ncbi:hypothetical protein BDV95DRAFT_570327 [Massariosphaeria phaeospora]|uniref:Uncharacterized protein n=1 Tax=Massariosphaeria phaeospora TaxID=100035 RepID=A0A7C8MQP3_9PLEO|nr:hypothetical protein BDV95DRAFT_570327 [Massariosphaeria phaeospora]
MAAVVADSQANLLFKEAFEKLEAIVKATNTQHVLVFNDSTLNQLHQACRVIEEDLRKRKCVRNMARLRPFLQRIHHYYQTIEVLCNGTPYVSWIWGPMKLILQIAGEYPAAIEKILSTYSKLADVLPQFDKLSQAFKEDADFQRRMALIYTDITEFHSEAYRFFNKRGWKLFFSTMWGNFDRRFHDILDSLAENCRLLETEAATTNIVESLYFRRRMEEERMKSEKDRAVAQLQGALKWLDVKDEEQEDEFDRQHELGHRNSCDWIQNKEPTRSWMGMGSNQPVMWLTGKPGAGKTVISATITRFLKQDGQAAVLYYFCGQQSSITSRPAHAMCTIIAQLIRQYPDMAAYIYDEHIVNAHAASITRIKKLLQTLVGTISCVRIILDGIDELDGCTQGQVIEDMLSLTTSAGPGTVCKVLISGRNVPSISGKLSRYPILDLDRQRQCMDASIASYTTSELARLHTGLQRIHQNSDDMIKKIREELIEKAEGMFLWVRLVLRSLEAYNLADFRNILHQLPKGLDSLYTRILRQIMSESEGRTREAVETILRWTIYGLRPLKVFETASALAQASGNGSWSNQTLAYEEILNLCRPILEETRNGTVQFIHFTAREYFIRGTSSINIDPLQASYLIASTCLSTLVQGLDVLNSKQVTDEKIQTILNTGCGLSRYSVHFWKEHVLEFLRKSRSGPNVDQLLDLMDQVHEKQQECEDSHNYHRPDLSELLGTSGKELLPAVFSSYPHLTDMILRSTRWEEIRSQKVFGDGNDVEKYDLAQDPTLFSVMLHGYKEMISGIMQPNTSFSPSSLARIADFKHTFTQFMFPCRFWGCGEYSRTTKEREEHEKHHTGGIKCAETSCSFSRIGFLTTRALKQHVHKHHSSQKPRHIITPVRKRYICSTVTDGVIHGCNRRFAFERQLDEHKASAKGTKCDAHQIRMLQINDTIHWFELEPATYQEFCRWLYGWFVSSTDDWSLPFEELRLARDTIDRIPEFVEKSERKRFYMFSREIPEFLNPEIKHTVPEILESWKQFRIWIAQTDILPASKRQTILLLQVAILRHHGDLMYLEQQNKKRLQIQRRIEDSRSQIKLIELQQQNKERLQTQKRTEDSRSQNRTGTTSNEPRSPSPLQPHELTLMELEQQNKSRLLKARQAIEPMSSQEHDLIRAAWDKQLDPDQTEFSRAAKRLRDG